MATYIIEGGVPLKGEVSISGNKNSVFPCIAAALLTNEEVVLENIPDIADVKVMIDILNSLGVVTGFENHNLTINANGITEHKIPEELSRKLRGSVVLVGALLSRFGKVEFSHPGGDIIGRRTIKPHLEGFEKLGFEVRVRDLSYSIKRNRSLKDTVTFFLEEPSVTATENLILASVKSEGKTVLKNCAKEPHIVDLCKMLVKMGANISGIGESSLTILGVKNLAGTNFAIGPDYIELGTYAVASVVTKGQIEIKNCSLDDLEPIALPLQKMGIHLEQKGDNKIHVWNSRLKPYGHLKVNVWPGFPSDFMSPIILLSTQVEGVSLLHDWMYESRMFFADKLISMGAHITIADPHRVLVSGPTKLYGREVESPDIRAGMTLVLAALVAEGRSVIQKAELIERGYEDVVGKLQSLGARIERLD